MNRNRIYSMLFLLITIPGFIFIGINQLILGIIFMGVGVITGSIFLHKAKEEEQ